MFLCATTEDLHFIFHLPRNYDCVRCILGSGGAGASLLSKGGRLRCNLNELAIYGNFM